MPVLDATDLANILSMFLETTIKFNMFEYKGNSSNIFSKIQGSFVGSIKFYSISRASFISDPVNPSLTNLIATLTNSGMTAGASIATNGEVILFVLSGFTASTDVVINYYNAALKVNTRVYIPQGTQTISETIPYYPSVHGVLYGVVSSATSVAPLTDGFINKNVNMISTIDWDRISSPVALTQTIIST